jgi:hypothetical protein
LPPDLPHGNIARLASGDYTECRMAAANHPACERKTLLQLATDAVEVVRKASTQRLAPCTADELDSLLRSTFPDVRAFAAAQPELPRNRRIQLCADPETETARAAFTNLALSVSSDELADLAINGNIWQEIVSHPRIPAARAADLISRYLPRSRYVVDVPEQGYEQAADSYGSSGGYVVTQAEQGHHEYDANDLALARRLIDAVPGRADQVMAELARVNHELRSRLAIRGA